MASCSLECALTWDFWLGTGWFGADLIFLIVLIAQSLFTYKVTGFTLWLLFALVTTVASLIVGFILTDKLLWTV